RSVLVHAVRPAATYALVTNVGPSVVSRECPPIVVATGPCVARSLMTPWSAVRVVLAGTWTPRREVVMIAATDTGLVPMRVSKVVALKDGDHSAEFMVLDELDGDRHLVIQVGQMEAFGLATSLQGLRWGRPMTHQFA